MYYIKNNGNKRFISDQNQMIRKGILSYVWDPTTDPVLSNGLMLDLCPDYANTLTLVGSGIAAINDRSSYGNNFIQATTGSQPTLVLNDSVFGNRATMTFNGTTQQELSTNIIQGLGSSGQVTLCVIDKPTAFLTGQGLMNMYTSFPPANGACLYWYSDAYMYTPGYRNGINTINLKSSTSGSINTPYRNVVTLDNSIATPPVAYYRNGVLNSSGNGISGTPQSIPATTWVVGSLGTSFYYKGTIARVLAWNRVLSTNELASLDQGLKSFYSLS